MRKEAPKLQEKKTTNREAFLSNQKAKRSEFG